MTPNGLRNDADRTSDRRRAWILGGSLLIAAAVLGSAVQPGLYALPGVRFAGPVLSGAALIVFALGVRGEGSITARRPLGTTALVALAVLGVAAPFILSLVSFEETATGGTTAITLAEPLLEAVAALIAVVQVGRAGVVPAPWSWAPAWAFAVLAATAVLQYVGFSTGAISQQAAGLMATLNMFVWTGVPVFLGVLAIVLATRPAPTRTVSIIDHEG